jgi:hypothetical protein
MAFYVKVGSRGILFRAGMIWTDVLGSLTYRWRNRRRRVIPVARFLAHTSGRSKQLMIRQSDESRTRKDELAQIRRACVDLGADQEMTELVLASHLHDPSLLDVMVANGDDLRGYVQRKLATWEAIFSEN